MFLDQVATDQLPLTSIVPSLLFRAQSRELIAALHVFDPQGVKTCEISALSAKIR
jgi:hypothetical protein